MNSVGPELAHECVLGGYRFSSPYWKAGMWLCSFQSRSIERVLSWEVLWGNE